MYLLTLPPIEVLVTDSRWDVVAEPTPHNIWLTQVLTEAGGVNESVLPGVYHFHAERVDESIVCTLTPAK